jgi:beta-glucanase (GH16 family)
MAHPFATDAVLILRLLRPLLFLLVVPGALSDGGGPRRTNGGRRGSSFCAPSGQWEFAWADDFNGPGLDEASWTPLTGNADRNVGACRDAFCTPEAVAVRNGTLVLTSDVATPGGPAPLGYNWTTGAVSTQGKLAWPDSPAYRLCVSAILPGGGPSGDGAGGTATGLWPAHWLMPDDDSCDPDEGEMDVLEMVSGTGVAYSTYHWQTTWPAENCSYPRGHEEVSAGTPVEDWGGRAFHEYAVERSSSYVAFVVDGVTVVNASAGGGGDLAPVLWSMPFYLYLNTAVGGGWPGMPNASTVFPAYHVIDYVLVSTQKQRQENKQ